MELVRIYYPEELKSYLIEYIDRTNLELEALGIPYPGF